MGADHGAGGGGMIWRHLEQNDGASGGSGGGGALATARAKAGTSSEDLVTRLKQMEEAFAAEEAEKQAALHSRFAQMEQKLQTERRERALAQAANLYPKADRGLINDYPSQDPEAILAYAKRLDEMAVIRAYDANGVPVPPSNQTDAMLSAEQSQVRRWQTQIRNNHLRRTIDPIEAEQAFETFWRLGWNRHMDERKRRAGLTIAPITKVEG